MESTAGMVGRSAALRAALDRLERLAKSDLPVLVSGETGTGKELAARHLHRTSARSKGPWVAVNCAAVSESLLLSDLFGHVRGAFTGAHRDRVGIFEAARGGTVLLDEIGDLPAAGQGMLLRVLQEGEIRRLGETASRRVDVRVIAATHRDLETLAKAERFRPDLLFRLAVGRVELPPLRCREDDVLLLADHILARLPTASGKLLAATARQQLLAYSWPGNVRELESRLAVAALLADGGLIEPRHLDLPAAAERVGGYHARVDSLRRRLVEEALTAASGNRAAAARRLGLSRQALSYLVRRLEIRNP